MNTERRILHCVRKVAGLGDDGTYFYHPEIRTAEAARERGLLRLYTRSCYPRRYGMTKAGWEWLPGALAQANELRDTTALARAPRGTTYPAITIELMSLLRHLDCVWQPRGIYKRREIGGLIDLRHPGARASKLLVFSLKTTERTVWWLGGGLSFEAEITEQAYGALMLGQPLPDGRIRIYDRVAELICRGPAGSREAVLWDVEKREAFTL